MPDTDTPSAVLTNKQREWLTSDDSDIPAPSERALRARIRERYPAAIRDLELLLMHWDKLSERDRKELDGVHTDGALAFLLSSQLPSAEELDEYLDDVDELKPGKYVTSGDRVMWLERLLKSAINRAAEEKGHPRRYWVEITPQEQDERSVIELKNQLRSGELSPDEVLEMYNEGDLPPDKFKKVAAAFPDDEDE